MSMPAYASSKSICFGETIQFNVYDSVDLFIKDYYDMESKQFLFMRMLSLQNDNCFDCSSVERAVLPMGQAHCLEARQPGSDRIRQNASLHADCMVLFCSSSSHTNCSQAANDNLYNNTNNTAEPARGAQPSTSSPSMQQLQV